MSVSLALLVLVSTEEFCYGGGNLIRCFKTSLTWLCVQHINHHVAGYVRATFVSSQGAEEYGHFCPV